MNKPIEWKDCRDIASSMFDEQYFRDHYLRQNPEVEVAYTSHVIRTVFLIKAAINYAGLVVGRGLDVGAGTGEMLRVLRRHLSVPFDGIDVSPWACAQYGWFQQDVGRPFCRGRYELVVCNDVLQYLSEDECKVAIENLAANCSGILYLRTITLEDIESGAFDLDHSDTNGMHTRLADWYRAQLAEVGFQPAAFGLHVHRDALTHMVELDWPIGSEEGKEE